MYKNITSAITAAFVVVLTALSVMFSTLACQGVPHSDEVEMAQPRASTALQCALLWPDFNGDCLCDRTADPLTNEDRNGDGACTLADYEGADGTSCSLAMNAQSCAVITCGTTVSVPICPPAACTVTSPSAGNYHLSCPDGTSVDFHDGATGPQGPKGDKGDKGDAGVNGTNGTNGTSCSVATNPQGCAVVTCTDGTTSAPVCPGANGTNGKDGTSCEPKTLPNSCVYVQCGTQLSGPVCPGANGKDGVDGTNGNDGTSCSGSQDPTTHCVTITCGTVVYTPICPPASCTVTSPSAGTYTMTCPDGTSVTWYDGATGPAGQNGTNGKSCTVAQTANICTMSCQDGTSATWDCGPAQTPSYDKDGDCYCTTAPCTGSINPLCVTILPGDCNDDPTVGEQYIGVQSPLGALEVRKMSAGVPAGYTLLFMTGYSYFSHPGATEVFDGVDNDCDGVVDEGFCHIEADCSGVPLTPHCNTGTGICVACTANSQCDDANVCTTDTCNIPTGACAHTNIVDGTSCEDGLFCNGAEICTAGVCTAGTNPCVAGQTCNETLNICEPVTTHVDKDGDGSYACEPGDPVGTCDCDDDPANSPLLAVWCRDNTTHLKFLIWNYDPNSLVRPTCPAGSTFILNTSGTALNRPGMYESPDGFDNNCNGQIDEVNTVDPNTICQFNNIGGSFQKVVCTWMN